MPCVQARERKEREAYIARNRRDVDAFEGVSDPVEALKIIHQPRKRDPLVNWIPHPESEEQLYCKLNSEDQRRLAEHAESLVSTQRHREAELITLCLAAFTDAPLESCLRALVANDGFWPGMAFRHSPPDLRDQLIVRVDKDSDNRNDILVALAWIGDATVVDLFWRWQRQPPAWQDSLHIPPSDYHFEAGWELSDNGQRRDLCFPACTKLVQGRSAVPETFRAIAGRDDRCPWCHQKLTSLIDAVLPAFGISKEHCGSDHVRVATCERCTTFCTVFGALDEKGDDRWSSSNLRPEYLGDVTQDWGRLPENSLTPAGDRPGLFAADQGLPTTFSQLGGHPTWIQDAEYPKCPACSKSMMFLAQIDHADIEEYSEGIFYAFICPSCATTATNYQQS